MTEVSQAQSPQHISPQQSPRLAGRVWGRQRKAGEPKRQAIYVPCPVAPPLIRTADDNDAENDVTTTMNGETFQTRQRSGHVTAESNMADVPVPSVIVSQDLYMLDASTIKDDLPPPPSASTLPSAIPASLTVPYQTPPNTPPPPHPTASSPASPKSKEKTAKNQKKKSVIFKFPTKREKKISKPEISSPVMSQSDGNPSAENTSSSPGLEIEAVPEITAQQDLSPPPAPPPPPLPGESFPPAPSGIPPVSVCPPPPDPVLPPSPPPEEEVVLREASDPLPPPPPPLPGVPKEPTPTTPSFLIPRKPPRKSAEVTQSPVKDDVVLSVDDSRISVALQNSLHDLLWHIDDTLADVPEAAEDQADVPNKPVPKAPANSLETSLEIFQLDSLTNAHSNVTKPHDVNINADEEKPKLDDVTAITDVFDTELQDMLADLNDCLDKAINEPKGSADNSDEELGATGGAAPKADDAAPKADDIPPVGGAGVSSDSDDSLDYEFPIGTEATFSAPLPTQEMLDTADPPYANSEAIRANLIGFGTQDGLPKEKHSPDDVGLQGVVFYPTQKEDTSQTSGDQIKTLSQPRDQDIPPSVPEEDPYDVGIYDRPPPAKDVKKSIKKKRRKNKVDKPAVAPPLPPKDPDLIARRHQPVQQTDEDPYSSIVDAVIEGQPEMVDSADDWNSDDDEIYEDFEDWD